MSAMIWDEQSQAFAESQNVPKRYDPNSGAYVDTAGKALDHDAQAWTEKWSPNRVLYLYKDGDECINVTGGWVTSYKSSGNSSAQNTSTGYVLSVSGTSYSVEMRTAKKINLKGYSKLYVEAIKQSDYIQIAFGVVKGNTALVSYPPGARNDNAIKYKEWGINKNDSSRETLIGFLDVSNIDDDFYVQFGAYSSGMYSSNTVTGVWLEA